MKKKFQPIVFLRNTMIVMFCIDSILKHKNSFSMVLLLLGIGVFLIINDYARYYYFYKDERKYIVSIIASVLVSTGALIFDGGYMAYYFYAIINDAFYVQKKWTRILVGFHALILLFMNLYGEFSGYISTFSIKIILEVLLKEGQSFIFSGLIYVFCLISFYSFHEMSKERREANRLNKELNESNNQLKEYAKKIEELTISRERSRVAGELHDSLGHSLTALIMHLDFIEKVMDSDKDRARELVIKTQAMARDSMGVLRKAVYALKEDKCIKGLKESINELIGNITSVEGINVQYQCDGNIEDMSPDLKNIIYRTIQEGITNSLKHGMASSISIHTGVNGYYARLVVEDNGAGCKNIIKGNGLMGIEERIFALKGTIVYLNKSEGGFGFDICIPLKEVISL